MKNNKIYWIAGLVLTLAATAGAEGPPPPHSSSGAASDTKAESTTSFGTPRDAAATRATAPSTADANEISGRVVKTDAKTLYIEHMGAIIALKIDRSTQLEGTDAKKIKSLEGQDIRAVFLVTDKKQNLAKIVEVADQAIGGSGKEFAGPPSPAAPSDLNSKVGQPHPSRSPAAPDSEIQRPSAPKAQPGSDVAGNKGSVPHETTGAPSSGTGAPSNPGY